MPCPDPLLSVNDNQVEGLLVVGGVLLLVTSLRIVLLITGAVSAGNGLHNAMLTALLKAPIRFFDRQVRLANKRDISTNKRESYRYEVLIWTRLGHVTCAGKG